MIPKARDLQNKALITFSYDDGRRNNYDLALPLHEKYGIPANFAIIAQRTLNPERWKRHMNPFQIVDAYRRGIEISSHGMAHERKFTELLPEELKFELEASREVLNGFLPEGETVDSLCIPYSAHNDYIIKQASKHYQIIRAHGDRFNDAVSPHALVSSFPLTNTTTFDDIKKRIERAIDQEKWVVLMLHGVVTGDRAEGAYDITTNLLDQILSYVSELDSHKLAPVTFGQVAKLRNQSARTSEDRGPVREHGSLVGSADEYTLAEEDGYLITYHQNCNPSGTTNNKLIISFGGLPSKKTASGFGSRFILKQGYDHIFVAQKALSQYQELSLDEFMRAVMPILHNRDVYTYGSSLGAYAALYYGGAINARIIASAPKNSAHPLMRQKRFEHVQFNHSELVNVPQSKYPPLILFDPYREQESKFIKRWVEPAYPNAHLIRLPFAGHTVLDTMQRSGVLKDFITSYVEHNIIMPIQLKEEESFIWHAEKGRQHLRENKIDIAKRHFQSSLKLHQNGEAVSGLAKIYLRLEKPHKAKKVIDEYFRTTGGYKDVPGSLRQKVLDRLD